MEIIIFLSLFSVLSLGLFYFIRKERDPAPLDIETIRSKLEISERAMFDSWESVKQSDQILTMNNSANISAKSKILEYLGKGSSYKTLTEIVSETRLTRNVVRARLSELKKKRLVYSINTYPEKKWFKMDSGFLP